MRRVLMISYYFPPLGGAGVQRTVKFVRYLPGFDYEPVVVTGAAAATVEWSPPDATLASELGDGLELHRVPVPAPGRSVGWRSRGERWLLWEERFARWWIDGVVTAGRQARPPIDLIYASMSPFETATAAARLARDLGVPWVADLRDPWALDDWLVFSTGVHRRIETRRMSELLASASAVVFNTPEATSQARRRVSSLTDKLVATIPNGFDASDFEGPAPRRTDGVFRIVHAGYVHTSPASARMRVARRVLGGAAPGFDHVTRSHLFLVEAVQSLLARRPDLDGKIEIHLAGLISAADDASLPPGLAMAHGYLSHADTIALLRSAHLLFLPMHDLADGVRARIVPGKTYEYLAAGPPILAAVPDGDARDLLAEAGHSLLCRPRNIAAMVHHVEQQVDRWLAGESPATVQPDVLARYERRRLTGLLGDVFDQVLGAPAAAAMHTRASRTPA